MRRLIKVWRVWRRKVVREWWRSWSGPFKQPKMDLLRGNLDRLKASLTLMLQVLNYARDVSSRWVVLYHSDWYLISVPMTDFLSSSKSCLLPFFSLLLRWSSTGLMLGPEKLSNLLWCIKSILSKASLALSETWSAILSTCNEHWSMRPLIASSILRWINLSISLRRGIFSQVATSRQTIRQWIDRYLRM